MARKKVLKNHISITIRKLLECKTTVENLVAIRTRPQAARTIAKWVIEVVNVEFAVYSGYQKKLIEHYNTAKTGEAVVNAKDDPKKHALYVKALDFYLDTEVEIKQLPLTEEELNQAAQVNGQNNITPAMFMAMAPFCRGYVAAPERAVPKLVLPEDS